MQVQGQNSSPTQASRWAEFLQKTALSVGSLLLASSVISWIAANWAYASTVQKLAGTQILLVLLALMTAWLLYFRPSPRPNFSASAYTAGLASVCLGGLLALVGQIYQTGADPWQLFLLWALLLLPWLVSLHTVVLGLLVALLFNIAAVLYFDAMDTSILGWIASTQSSMAVFMVLLNLLMLATWESALRRLDDGWRIGPRVLGAVIVAWMAWASLTDDLVSALGGLALMAVAVWFYTQRRRDLAMVAWAGLGILGIVAVQLISRINSEMGLLLVIAVLVALAAWMLRYLRRQLAQSDSSSAPTEAVERGEPWFISLFRLSAMMLTAILMLAFLFMILDLRSTQLWPVGLAVVAIGLLALRRRSTGVIYEAGATLVCAGLFLVGVGVFSLDMVWPYGRGLGLLLLAALVYMLCSGFALRWLSVVFCLVVALAITWPTDVWDHVWLDGLTDSGRELGFYVPAYLRVWWLTIFAVLALAASAKTDQHARWAPLAWALLVVAQLVTLSLPSVGWFALAGYWSDHFSLMLLALACALLPLAALSTLLWSVRGLPAAVRIGAPLVLAVACLAWMGAPGVSLGLLWLILGFAYKRRAVMVFGVLSMLGYLGAYYYQLEVSLLHKSWLLGATGLWLLASWWLLQRLVHARRQSVDADAEAGTGNEQNDKGVHSPRVWRIAGVLAGLLLMLVVVNNGIYQREQILSSGSTVVLELAPVDPRSLMQGDYMALRFDVASGLQRNLSGLPDALRADIDHHGLGYLVLVPDAQGVHRLFGVQASLDGPVFAKDTQASPESRGQQAWSVVDVVPANRVLMEFRIRGWQVKMATNAWFFPEGQAQHFEQAKYGEFKVSSQGVGLLKDMLDQDRLSLSAVAATVGK
ncbi:MAG: GDYXXLXY domain-containing protein [Burkholderiaceae bacterium]|nr:GDYXXLXY domain-containing protein [Burkholderiaceae bacterium]